MSEVSATLDLGFLSMDDQEKLTALRHLIRSFSKVIIAYSGGVDSSFLLKVAFDELGDSCRAFTARSPSLMKVELDEAAALAEMIGVQHEIVDTNELGRPGYVQNEQDRCYFCKSELFDATQIAAERVGMALVCDGFNLDDLKDHRPGHQAAHEHEVRHPLAEVGMGKAQIRRLSKHLGLPTWSKPQLACLASRIPYGMTVTEKRLAMIEELETALRQLGFHDFRARLVDKNDEMVRIEIGESEFQRLLETETRQQIVAVSRRSGFKFVTLDLEAFRSGRMNEGLIRIGAPLA